MNRKVVNTCRGLWKDFSYGYRKLLGSAPNDFRPEYAYDAQLSELKRKVADIVDLIVGAKKNLK